MRLNPRWWKISQRLRKNFWARPLVLIVIGAALGVVMPIVDETWIPPDVFARLPVLRHAAPDATREVMLAGVGALATILAVAFSMTMVMVQLASSQYSPRLLRTFMNDRKTQLVLGAFIGTMVYVVLVLRTLRAPEDEQGFLPAVSILLGLAATIFCLGLLAWFLHHATDSVNAATIIARVGRETIRAVHELPRTGSTVMEEGLWLEPSVEPAQVASDRTGYVELIDLVRLVRALPKGTRIARLEAKTGDFIIPGTTLLSYWPRAPSSPRCIRGVQRAFALGSDRTIEQDVLYGVRRLVDVALKALSPAVNDVTTAVMVVNELGAVGRAIANRGGLGTGWEIHRIRDVVLLVEGFGLSDFLEEAYSEIPRAAQNHPRVIARILETLADLAHGIQDPEMLAMIERFGGEVRDSVDEAHLVGRLRMMVEERWLALQATVRHAPPDGHMPEPLH